MLAETDRKSGHAEAHCAVGAVPNEGTSTRMCRRTLENVSHFIPSKCNRATIAPNKTRIRDSMGLSKPVPWQHTSKPARQSCEASYTAKTTAVTVMCGRLFATASDFKHTEGSSNVKVRAFGSNWGRLKHCDRQSVSCNL